MTTSEARAISREDEAPSPGPWQTDLRAARVLWKRDLLKFFRHRTRIAGAVAQPLIFWIVLGSGLGKSFTVPNAPGVGYLEYFYPGVLLMMILFSAIFGTMSVIEDRREGFLQAVLVAPSSRGALVMGKVFGSSSVAMVQSALLLIFVPWAGFSWGEVDWLCLFASLCLLSISLTALGFALAWWLDSTQAYHALMSVALIPAWLVSGALFPAASASGWLGSLMRLNPLAYGLEVLRSSLYGAKGSPAALSMGSDPLMSWGALVAFCFLSCAAATWLCRREARPHH